MKRPALIAIALLQLVAVISGKAQVTARQGTATPPDEAHFASPMVLELPLPNIAALEPGSSIRLASVHKYICDNHVTLRGLTVGKHYRGSRKSRSLDVILEGSIVVTDSFDRRVDIGVKLLDGKTELATQTLRNHRAEEERATPFRMALPVNEPALLAALVKVSAPTIELTLTVRDDS